MRAHTWAPLAVSLALAVSVLSAHGRPADSQVGNARTANGPMRVALLVDTSDGIGSTMTQIRAAAAAFADALAPGHELMLVTTGRHTEVRVPPTLDHQKVKDSARGLTADHGPTPLIDALMEIDQRFMRNAGDRWGAFVVITGNGSESSIRTDDKGFNDWLSSVSRRRISIDAIVLKFEGNGMPEVIAKAAARASDGHVEDTTMAATLPDKLKAIAERLGAEHSPQH